MTDGKILGAGGANCHATQKLIEEVLAADGVQARVGKIMDFPRSRATA